MTWGCFFFRVCD